MSKKTKVKKTMDELLVEALAPEDEQPYEVPENWVWVYLQNTLEKIQYGYTESSTNEEIGPKFLRITDIQNELVNWDEVPYCKIDAKQKENYSLKSNDIVIARTGATTGKSYLIKNCPDSVFASYLIRLRVSRLLCPEYLWTFMRGPNYWKQIMIVKKGSTQPSANAKILGKLNLPLPPLNEQKRIANKVERLLNKIDQAKQLIEEAKATFELRQAAILDKAFRGELTAKWRENNRVEENAFDFLHNIDIKRKMNLVSNEKPNYLNYKFEKCIQITDELPKTWAKAPVGFLCDCIVPGRDKPKSFSGGIPWITIPDIESDLLNTEDASYFLSEDEISQVKAKVIPENSVVMSCVGRFGISAIVATPLVINQQLHAFLPSEMIDPKYLMYHIRILVPYMNRSATSTTISYLNKTKANSLPINVPPIREQIEIVKILDNYFEKNSKIYDLLEQQYMIIDQLKQSILSKAFRGELGTNDPTEESAIELLKEVLQEQIS